MRARLTLSTYSKRTTNVSGISTVTAVALASIVVIFLSPLALGFIANGDTDWNRLSLIGQSYGAISAILAALAVLGVVLSLRLQQQQIADNRRMAIRQQQRDLLLVMAIDDPDLLRTWGKIPIAASQSPKLSVYANLVLNYMIMLYDSGTAELDEIGLHLRAMAAGDWMPEYWASTRATWQTSYPPGRHPVVDLMDLAFSEPSAGR
ncbi:DUF6082 family protein [Catenuloplanes sp. NPDC051500]|uniref:DUF6082 family protein n=1 Tax=Catenuloplanes sp. NPDC051500 TaxID=3363959 RepID=UPI0037A2A27D